MKIKNLQELLTLREAENEKLRKRLENSDTVEIIEDGYKLKGEYYKKQVRIALRNCEIINPESLDEAIACDAYAGLAKLLDTKKDPLDVVEEILHSNLRGRGGAGFVTGKKWKEATRYSAEHKYVICNADEGDPGAYMDRSLLENDPHAILEGMAIAGYAIGADYGYVYVRAEYPLAVERLSIAIEKAKERGLLGENILGSDFSFNIEIRLGAGAFVCGEGTALMESIEGRRGMPRFKKYRTAQKGLFGMPTIINNVETLACVPSIIRNGSEWFKSIGTEDSAGTKVFALVGKVANAGLVEVPMGTTLREIVYDIGGGCKGGTKLKAVQTGGPSGGCIPEDLLDTPVDFGSLKKIGSIMGSGGLVIMDENDCMVDIARFFIEFSVDESCGKCTPCRIGNKRILELLDKIIAGNGKEKDIAALKELCNMICDTSLCGLGQSSPNPVLSTLRFFEHEYLEHIKEKRCRAGVCKALARYEIGDICVGCGLCKKKCPISCISGELKSKHVINQDDCLHCGACYAVCPVKAIVRA